MKMTFDQNLFTQVGLDSGSLTMLGGVTHRFLEAGRYRGVVYRGSESIGKFYINVDQNSPVAQANIDLAAFDTNLPVPSTSATATACGCQGDGTKAETTFEVNPKGYAVFHVSAGAGGYAVRASKAAEDPRQQNQFDSRELKCEDIFSAVILRPGTYSASNGLNAKAKGKITVGYPKLGKAAYRPPSPAKVVCSQSGFEPANLELQPGQAVLFQANEPSRITLELVKADDGPAGRPEHMRGGWKKAKLPEQNAKKHREGSGGHKR